MSGYIRSLIIFCCCCTGVKAQQIPQYTQWFHNQLAINPAHAGIKSCVDVKTQFRAQYVGLEGAPNSGNFTFSIPLYAKREKFYSARHGLGMKFERDQLGAFTGNKFQVNYAAHFNFTQESRLSVGIGAGIEQWGFNKAKATTLEVDPLVLQSSSFIAPDVSVGAWWNGKNYFVGFAFHEVLRSKWQDISSASRFKFHYILNGGYRWLVKEGWSLMPYAILRIPPNAKISADLSLMVDYNNQFSIGAGYRNTDAFLFFIQAKFKEQFAIGYSFDYVVSPIGRNEFFTHEISLTLSGCKSMKVSKTGCSMF